MVVDGAGNTPGGSGRLDEPAPQSPRLIELIRVAEDRERIAEDRRLWLPNERLARAGKDRAGSARD